MTGISVQGVNVGSQATNKEGDCRRAGKMLQLRVFLRQLYFSHLSLPRLLLHLLLLLFTASSSLSGRTVSQFLRNAVFPVPWSPGAHW